MEKKSKANLSFIDKNFGANNPKSEQSSREKVAEIIMVKLSLLLMQIF